VATKSDDYECIFRDNYSDGDYSSINKKMHIIPQKDIPDPLKKANMFPSVVSGSSALSKHTCATERRQLA